MALVFATVTWPILTARLGLTSAGVEIRSVEERAILSDAAVALIQMHLWFGVGLSSFSAALYRLLPEAVSYYSEFTPVHSVLISERERDR